MKDRTTFEKRRRERERQLKQRAKLQRRQERSKAKREAKEAALRGDPVPSAVVAQAAAVPELVPKDEAT